MKIKDLDIVDHHYYPDFDVFLIRAWRPGTGKRLPRAIVGWMQRTNPEELIETKSFSDIASAMRAFEKIGTSGDFPESFTSFKDQQVEKVYDWEDRVLFPNFDRELTQQKNAQMILRKISKEQGIKCPKLLWVSDTRASDYDSDSNEIRFGHRSLMPLLHEMAHALHARKLDENDGDMHHSPGFVWYAIDLYHRYAGIDLDYLVQTAVTAGILGPLQVQGPKYYIKQTDKSAAPHGPMPG